MIKRLLTLFTILAVTAAVFADGKKVVDGNVTISNLTATPVGERCIITMDVILDQLHLSRNHQLFVTPYIESNDKSEQVQLPSILISGRNMHYIYLRTGETKATGKTKYDITKELYHKTGDEVVEYNESTPLLSWMMDDDVNLFVHIDTCGCGRAEGSDVLKSTKLGMNPVSRMLMMPYPKLGFDEDKITKHEGRAKVQFEVDKFELHDEVYSYVHRQTRRKHVIDNREQLKIIDDSLHYALSSPNVELVGLEICGYASPESPYDHNEYLALNRARAVVEYVEKHDNIPAEICSYRAVPENWADFRQQVLAATDITDQQRQDLLELIDRPIHSTSDYDRKETELKTSKKFAELYASKIHPDWFPDLRYTHFSISTHLKPRTVEQLREIVKTEPHLMSLNQFYQVALSYEHGSKEFTDILLTALKFYPKEEKANVNVASLLIEQKKYDEAQKYLDNAGDSDEANILRGIVCTYRKDFAEARRYFLKAGTSTEAQNNLKLIK